jgi:DNA primase
MNILDLLTADGIQAKHASRNEHHSSCPKCGGNDRFSTWPDRINSNGRYMGGRFVCRGCGINGDAVSYLQRRRGISYREACRQLDVEPGIAPAGYRQQRTAWTPAQRQTAPKDIWQDRGKAFLLSCHERLNESPDILNWLHDERGLTVETIQRFGLGFNDIERYERRELWGLSSETKENGKPKKQWIPAGLTIPYCENSNVLRIRIRREKADEYGRYIVVSGSSMQAMTLWQDQQSVAIVESELDAILMNQDAGDIVGVVALGSAQAKPDAELHHRLMNVKTILCCLDADDAGAKASWGHWTRYPGFKRWPTIAGKDVCEQWQAGIPVKQWINAGL